MSNPIPFNGPMNVTPVDKEPYVAFLKAKHDAIGTMCVKLADFLGEFGSQAAADELSMAVRRYLSLEIEQEIDSIENPRPSAFPQTATHGPTREEAESKVLELTEAINNLEQQLQLIEEQSLDAPSELQANLTMGKLHFKNEVGRMIEARTFWQGVLEKIDTEAAKA